MRNFDKKEVTKLSAAAIILVFLLTMFSIDLGLGIPPLGSVLFPGNGLWNVPGEVPTVENLRVSGMTDDVTVIRDEWGIPHIYASDEGDLSFALGYVHAQDRLFQMDMARRSVSGRLSEIPGIGAMALNKDKFQLATGKLYWANQTLQEYLRMQDEGEIEFFDDWLRYADGVNYYINTHQNEMPLEYHILGFQPTEWKPVDTFLFAMYMAEMLSWSYNDLSRLIGFETFSSNDDTDSWWDEIFDPSYPYEIPIIPEFGNYSNPPVPSGNQPNGYDSLVNTISNFIYDASKIDSQREIMNQKEIIGSNNWVVNGSKTTTGKPILCNDMHLRQNLPGIWYEAHLVSSDTGLNTYGFTLAGVPLPLVGHNEYVAWGFTNTGYDVMDWYYFNGINDTHYIYNHSETEYEYRTYTINVAGQDSVEFTAKDTVHGPVLNDFLGSIPPESLGGESIILAPKWTANNISHAMQAIYGWNHAQNKAEFDEASSWFHNPSQNIIYADIEGNIAIRPTGLVPIRDDSKIPPGYLGNGSLPYNGSAGYILNLFFKINFLKFW